jgi:hypothetical protein
LITPLSDGDQEVMVESFRSWRKMPAILLIDPAEILTAQAPGARAGAVLATAVSLSPIFASDVLGCKRRRFSISGARQLSNATRAWSFSRDGVFRKIAEVSANARAR